MDKQQATTYIVERLHAGQKRADIVADLVHQLNAPEEVVARFVDEVAAGYSKPPFEPEIHIDLPSLKTFILTEGTTYNDTEDLVYEVCRRTGWKWSQAEAFIKETVLNQQRQRMRRKLLVFLPPGLLLTLGGIGLLYTTIHAALQSGLTNGSINAFIENVLPALVYQQWPRLAGGVALFFIGMYSIGKAAR